MVRGTGYVTAALKVTQVFKSAVKSIPTDPTLILTPDPAMWQILKLQAASLEIT